MRKYLTPILTLSIVFAIAFYVNADREHVDGKLSYTILSGTIDDTIIGGTTPAAGTFTTCAATTFDTNVAAAAVTLTGTTLAADGTDADINIAVTPKGTGEVDISKVDIDSGTIDGATIATSDITVGAGKTLDVSAGTLTLADGQIPADKLQSSAADLGAADVTVDLGNTNGSYNTNLTTDGIVNASKIGANEATPEEEIEITTVEPRIILHNSSEEDSDGGRESRIVAFGEQSGGEETTLGYLEFYHDGTGDDEKGGIMAKINDTDDGDSPSVSAFIVDSGEAGFGYAALQNNTGANSTAIGYVALYNNTGAYSTASGAYALSGNTGVNSTAGGHKALYNNTGANSTATGYAALYNNTGVNNTASGAYALYNNTGANSTATGYFALQNNTGANSTATGAYAGRYNQESNNIAIGYEANSDFNDNAGGAIVFADTDVNVDTDVITVTGHSFGSNGTYVNVRYDQGTGVAIGGLVDESIYKVYIVDANSVDFNYGAVATNITSAGSGADYDLTPQTDYEDTIAIGISVEPTADHQVILGGATITETQLKGKLVNTPVTFEFTTEEDITDPLATSVLLLSGDNDSDNDAIDIQNGTTAGQLLHLIAAANIDADDTCTINMADTTCTGCAAVVFDSVGDCATLIWTGTTWAVINVQPGS